MSIVELIFPVRKKRPGVQQEADQILLSLVPTFKAAGATHGIRGMILEEDGADVEAEQRAVILHECDTYSSYEDFCASPGFGDFLDRFKDVNESGGGGAMPQLHEMSGGVRALIEAGEDGLVNVLVVRPLEDGEDGFGKVLDGSLRALRRRVALEPV